MMTTRSRVASNTVRVQDAASWIVDCLHDTVASAVAYRYLDVIFTCVDPVRELR